MQPNPGPLTAPLDWAGLVAEALRRRRNEGLTQKEHAELAGVSIPTILAFDRGKTTLSLAKAMDILRVVGLVNEKPSMDPQDVFVEAAERRWQELTENLPYDSPTRHPHGHYIFDYEIVGASARSGRALLDALRVADRKYTGWPPFWIPTRERIKPYILDDTVECWLGNPDAEHILDDAAHSDFWRASTDSRLFLRRGYQEDTGDVLAPATVFDLTLPIWRAGEVLMHGHHLAKALNAPDAEVKFRVRFHGLAGRELKSWADPHRDLFEDYRCRMDMAAGSVSCIASGTSDRLPELVHGLLAPVYEHFGFFELPRQLVVEELTKLRKRRSARRSSS